MLNIFSKSFYVRRFTALVVSKLKEVIFTTFSFQIPEDNEETGVTQEPGEHLQTELSPIGQSHTRSQ